jgi:hypothetical protein
MAATSKRLAAAGGAYAEISNLSLTPGGTVTIQVGSGGLGGTSYHESGADGGDTYFNGTSCATASVCAAGGNGAPDDTHHNNTTDFGGAGGLASSSTGDVIFSGGSGGSITNWGAGGGGGGGAAGPSGAGGNAGNETGSNPNGYGPPVVGSDQYEYSPNGYCAIVTVTKDYVSNAMRTFIEADGYNLPCALISSSPDALQRAVELEY